MTIPLAPDALLTNTVLAVPLLLVVVAATARADDLARRAPAAFLASFTAWVSLMLVEQHQPWWRFADSPTSLGHMPMEISLGWALAWGALPVLVGGPVWVWLIGFGWVDLMVVGFLPGLELDPRWLIGEGLLLVLSALPALALGRLTVLRTALWWRVGLQAVVFSAAFVWLVPTLALDADGLGWSDVVDHPYPVRSLLLALAVALTVPALSAVVELGRAGGTPFPWDPPQRLVTTGPYAYLANPMQCSMSGLLALVAVAAGSWTLGGAAACAITFSAVLAERHERHTLGERWPEYVTYRAHVRAWWPRWRPWVPAPTTLWVSQTCELCAATGAVVTALAPTGLSMRAAEEAPTALRRMTWTEAPTADREPTTDRGIAAFARAIEQTHLGWAWIGWWMRLPGVCQVLQLLADAAGLGPRDIPRNPQQGAP